MQDIPILMINESLENIDFTSPVRHNILGSHKNIEKKVEYNLKACFEEVDESKKESLIRTFKIYYLTKNLRTTPIDIAGQLLRQNSILGF